MGKRVEFNKGEDKFVVLNIEKEKVEGERM
jgi:hypothetical protein